MFLSAADLKELTGYKVHSKQAAWLAENGYQFDIRADGRPNVLLEQIRERQCKNATPVESRPNLAALDEFE